MHRTKKCARFWLALGGWVAATLPLACTQGPVPVSTAEAGYFSNSTQLGRNFGRPWGTPYSSEPEPGDLDVVAEASFFLQELAVGGHSDDALEGETFLGVLLGPRVRFVANEQFSIELGGILGRDFGDDNALDDAEPLVRLIYEPTDGLYFIGGTIYPTHAMHEALLNDIQKLRDNIEEGLQFRADTDRWKQDFWLNWQRQEEPDRREEFEVGNVTQFRCGRFRFDAQGLWHHSGGQRNTVPGTQNNITALGGASFGIPIGEDHEVRVGAHALYNRDDSDDRDDTGSGAEASLIGSFLLRENVTLHPFLTHYSGEDLVSRRGEPLYRLDRYSTLGSSLVFETAAGLRIEPSAAVWLAEGETDFMFQLVMSWGAGWTTPVKIEPRVR